MQTRTETPGFEKSDKSHKAADVGVWQEASERYGLLLVIFCPFSTSHISRGKLPTPQRDLSESLFTFLKKTVFKSR